MATFKYDRIIKYDIKARCNGPLHIGNAIGGAGEVLVHPVSGQPFLQASGVAGVFRAYCTANYDSKKVDYLFGDVTGNRSRLVFSDGIFDINTVKMERRAHVKIDRKTGSVTTEKGSGQKYEMEYIGAGSEFIISIIALIDSSNVEVSEIQIVEDMLSALNSKDILFGAKKSSGAGKISPLFISKNEYDMKSKDGRDAWASSNMISAADGCAQLIGENQIDKLAKRKSDSVAYKVKICGATEGALQIKGIAVNSFGKGEADSENVKNAEGNYIIPGSSLRGVVRSQMEKIAGYLSKQKVVSNAFGYVAESQKDSYSGNLIFSDSIVGDKINNDLNEIRHRIHINKFTGAVFNKGLFSEKNVVGNIELSIDILNKNNADATLGLLIMAIRDLSIKTFSLGSGYATGKGFVNISEIIIEAHDKTASICFGDNIQIENEEVINDAIKALGEVE